MLTFFALMLKRTSEMSQDSSEVSQQSWASHFHPPSPQRSSSRPAVLPHGQPQPSHPVIDLNNDSNVVDLTHSPETPPLRLHDGTPDTQTSRSVRPPRFGRPILRREVVDLVNEPDSPPEPPYGSRLPGASTIPGYRSTLQYVYNPDDPTLNRMIINRFPGAHRPTPSGRTPPPCPGERVTGSHLDQWSYNDTNTWSSRMMLVYNENLLPISRRNPDYDHNQDVQILGSTTRPRESNASRYLQPETVRRYYNNRQINEQTRRRDWAASRRQARTFYDADTIVLGQSSQSQNGGPGSLILDYGSAAFDIQQPTEGAEAQRSDTYKAPSPAPEGFTRTLADDDVAICPNCYCELGVGDKKKEEIWVAKPCGHVYCGECAENRSKSKARKTPSAQKTKHFSKCQVADCGRTLSAPTAMFHLYL
ncbi:hypothetical protein N7520_011046 [Penicillium odoratum]|uniref:uncharacterized protein n=1 Tax=Penicillium odoratum TaxID=1167516 RepID=UPI002547F936|nr:uncharacterized protein N7520_011046 [Penicillium odoratum]KAJ5745864.1 hypothetical protein N7520_011046 [Penicillium odoratum]